MRRQPDKTVYKETDFAGHAYHYFLFWNVCTSLTLTICILFDTILIGNIVGSDGIAIINIATPVFLVYNLIGITLGSGASVQIGRYLGASDIPGARRAFSSVLTIGAICGVLCCLPLLFYDTFSSFLGAGGTLYETARDYLIPVICFAPAFIINHILSAAVRTDSDPRCDAIASVAVIATNLLLDILFMKGFGWGIFGAVAALCAAKLVGLLVLLSHFLKKHRLLTLAFSIPRTAELHNFVKNGFGIGSANIFGAVVMLVFNTLLLRCHAEYGTLYVAIYGVIYTVNTVPNGFFEGTSNALCTVTAFLIGESEINGVRKLRNRAVYVAAVGGSAMAALCLLFPEQIIVFFGITDATAIPVSASALRLFAVSIFFSGLNTVITAYWQAIQRAKAAGAASAIRNCVLMIVFGLLLIPNFQVKGLALTYLCAEIACMLLLLTIGFLSPSEKALQKQCRTADKDFEKMYIIRTESAEQISADLEQLCEQWEIDAKSSFFINFVCEEVLLNIIKNALKSSKKDYYISIKLTETDGSYMLRIRDNVRLYDPFESDGDEIDNGVMKIIRLKTKHCEYQRKMIFNYLQVILEKRGTVCADTGTDLYR